MVLSYRMALFQLLARVVIQMLWQGLLRLVFIRELYVRLKFPFYHTSLKWIGLQLISCMIAAAVETDRKSKRK